jgi:hypothetical protein
MKTWIHWFHTQRARSATSGAVLMASIVACASAASARNEFKNGFEDEWGRIVAHQVAAVGRALWLPPIVVREPLRIERPRPRVVAPPRVWRPRPRAHPRRSWNGPRAHRHRHCDRHRASRTYTVIETREIPRKDRRGRHYRRY